jgi:zinc protease
MTIEAITSPGGIQAWLVRSSAVPIVAINFAFRGGASQDPADKPGVANMITALLDEGAGPYDSHVFHQMLDDRAADFRFNVGHDYFRGSMRVLKDNYEQAFDLLRLMLNEPRFDASAVERIRAQLKSDLIRANIRPGEIASRAWWSTAFPDHPYGRPVRGTPESLEHIGVDDLKAFRQNNFARDGLTVALVGDISAEDAGKLLDTVFGALPAKGALTPVSYAMPQDWASRSFAISTCRNRPWSSAVPASSATIRISSPATSSTISSAAARSPRGSTMRCARSVALPTRSTKA